jgi:hypothetical protein
VCLFAAAHFVRKWHLADMAIALNDVRFTPKSGRRRAAIRCLLLTQSGHQAPDIAVPHNAPSEPAVWYATVVGPRGRVHEATGIHHAAGRSIGVAARGERAAVSKTRYLVHMRVLSRPIYKA